MHTVFGIIPILMSIMASNFAFDEVQMFQGISLPETANFAVLCGNGLNISFDRYHGLTDIRHIKVN